ncbi:MaoC family dehydratase [Tomitella cavernea]|uniref:MaoC family dehydratase n=1 Tax=Tomitella cavernea TaxID=1387982 RepID=A0ABP9C056_9ACTN|nr:MaoC family dehydratase [Tomitella cavernea]
MTDSWQTSSIGAHDFTNPVTDRWLEDYVAGEVFEYGSITVTEDDILEFAHRYDPQSIHIDEDSAREGPFGGLIASGWQTASVFMRMFADNFLTAVGSLSSPGIDELRWTAPVRPGDTLRIRVTVDESRRSRSKPDRGIIRTTGEMFNQDGAMVLTLRAMNLIAARPA